MNQPPPPPPHGDQARSSGLPQGNYDIFIIPPHSSGGGFLYLPSLQPHRNSFLAGAASTGILVILYQIVYPVFRNWFAGMMASGGMGVLLLVMAVGVAGWAWGKTQTEFSDGSPRSDGPGKTQPNPENNYANGSVPGGQNGNAHRGPPPQFNPTGSPNPNPGPGSMPGGRPKPSWQRAHTSTAGSTTGSATGNSPRTTWEQKKEETRRRQEEERQKQQKEEADRRAKEAAENLRKEHARTREREAREREARDKEAKEAKEKESRERGNREAREREAREMREREARNRQANGGSPPKQHQQPTARTYMGSDEETYSFRPYDKPKRHTPKQESHSSYYTESSYADSHSTSRTTPPPSQRGRYTTKDPDKIVIKAVYSFSNTFNKLPTAQLVSGVGSVTDGLILRITTEGLFIDDDVRNVPQREWDVKAWTMKLVEVGCPSFNATEFRKTHRSSSSHRLFSSSSQAASKDAEALLSSLLETCASSCKSRFPSSASASSIDFSQSSNSKDTPINPSSTSQTGELKGIHVLRASIRDQEGKRYFFVLDETEGWKVALGLQRLRKGSQVRALGVTSIGAQEARGILSTLGWVI